MDRTRISVMDLDTLISNGDEAVSLRTELPNLFGSIDPEPQLRKLSRQIEAAVQNESQDLWWLSLSPSTGNCPDTTGSLPRM